MNAREMQFTAFQNNKELVDLLVLVEAQAQKAEFSYEHPLPIYPNTKTSLQLLGFWLECGEFNTTIHWDNKINGCG